MVYETQNCYPDLLDFESTLVRLSKDKSSAEAMYQDFRAAYEWLRIALHVCHNNSKHYYQSLSDIKKIAETFIGRSLNDDSFVAAVVQAANRKLSGVQRDFSEVRIKAPRLDESKIAGVWNQDFKS